MKKLLFIFIILVSFVYAKPCMTDIYFGNGVWNTQDEGEEGRNELKFFMQYRSTSRLETKKEGIEYEFKHAYNPSYGTTEDLIETFYQLKENGQISEGYFTFILNILTVDLGLYGLVEKFKDIVRTYNDDAFYMFTKYDNESFSKKHNVLLVAHSQGNLFGNKMYTLMNDAQKEKFRMVSVATPADHVAGGGPYVTASGDYVIVPIQGSLPANVIGFGHTFLGTYLNIDGEGVPGDGSNTAPLVIAPYVKSAYDNLMQTTSCTEYDYVYLYLDYLKDSMRVVGKIANVFENEVIAEVPLTDIVNTGNACGSAYPYFFMHPNLVMQADDSALWDISPFQTQNEVALKEFTVLKYATIDNKCVTVSFSDTLFDSAYDALDKGK